MTASQGKGYGTQSIRTFHHYDSLHLYNSLAQHLILLAQIIDILTDFYIYTINNNLPKGL